MSKKILVVLKKMELQSKLVQNWIALNLILLSTSILREVEMAISPKLLMEMILHNNMQVLQLLVRNFFGTCCE